MDKQFSVNTMRLLTLLKENAPKLTIYKAMEVVEDYQDMIDHLQKYEYIILTFLDILGFDDNGYLRDSDKGEWLATLPDEIWDVLNMSTLVHSHNTVGLASIGLKERMKKTRERFKSKAEDIKSYKETQLNAAGIKL